MTRRFDPRHSARPSLGQRHLSPCVEAPQEHLLRGFAPFIIFYRVVEENDSESRARVLLLVRVSVRSRTSR